MAERANMFAIALFVRSLLAVALAAAALLGVSRAASAANDCLDNPDFRVTGPGHWFYRLDRTLNRRCWHFEPEAQPAQAAAAAPTPAPAPTPTPTPTASTDNNTPQALLSRFAAGLSQTFSPSPQQTQKPPQPQPPQQTQPQQNSIPATTAESAQTSSPPPVKHNKIVRRERHDAAPPPTTTGAATAEPSDPEQQSGAEKPAVGKEKSAVEKNEKRDPPHNVLEREALFQDFMKWQMQRSVSGSP